MQIYRKYQILLPRLFWFVVPPSFGFIQWGCRKGSLRGIRFLLPAFWPKQTMKKTNKNGRNFCIKIVWKFWENEWIDENKINGMIGSIYGHFPFKYFSSFFRHSLIKMSAYQLGFGNSFLFSSFMNLSYYFFLWIMIFYQLIRCRVGCDETKFYEKLLKKS